MSGLTGYDRTAPDATKETPKMPKRLTALAVSIGAILLLLLPAASASAKSSPWWQVLPGSRPTNLWQPTDNVQEISTELNPTFNFATLRVEVNGTTVGCLGTGPFAFFCLGNTGFPASETAAQLEAMLESAFGTSAVEVSGGPVGGAPFVVTTPGRPEPTIKVTPTSPGFSGNATVKVLSTGGSGRLIVTLTNLGDAPVDGGSSPVTIVDRLPEEAEATEARGFAGPQGLSGPVDCAIEAADEVLCTTEATLRPFEAIEVEVAVSLSGEPPHAGEAGTVAVSGGGAPAASVPQTIQVSPEPTPFGIEHFSSVNEEEGGGAATQAGSHTHQLTTTIQANAGRSVTGAESIDTAVEQPAMPRNLRFSLPAGLVGNVAALPQCPMSAFFDGGPNAVTNSCPTASAIGAAAVTVTDNNSANLGYARKSVPVFNLEPGHGEPARFGFTVTGDPVVIGTAVDPDDQYRIIARIGNVTQVIAFLSSTVSLWGDPSDPRHDGSRGWACIAEPGVAEAFGPCERPAGLPEAAFLRNAVSCAAPLDWDMEMEPWNAPLGSQVVRATYQDSTPTGCNRVPFDPRIESAATSKAAASPSGLGFELKMPNAGLLDGDAIAEGQPKRVEVTLPEGMTLNPSAAEGLASCSSADYARERYDSAPGEGCPDASKVGSVTIDTPILEEQVKGSLYVASSYDNPFDSLLATYIVAKIPERGVLVKLPIEVKPDPRTGQLVGTVYDAPQIPFSSFKLSFREGARVPLATPEACGTYRVTARMVPWSAKDPDNPLPEETVTRESSFTIDRGPDGGPCPATGARRFQPGFSAGSVNSAAGAHTDFLMGLTRKDGEQDMTRFSAVLPPGVLGKLAGVQKCSDAQIARAKSRTGADAGKEEIADPSCPAGSQIGTTSVGAGVGSVLTWVPGKLYLAGPVKGAPLSVVAITPVVAGPFDVGTVVVREGLSLNPRTAEVEVDGSASDPIPHILKGIPAKLRELRVFVDRPDFILNPTSCEESSTSATLFGGGLDAFSSADDVPVSLRDRFQASSCASLGFKPKLALKLKGGTRRGAHPGLRAIYTPHKGDANLAGLVTRLPRSAFLDQAHIRTICTRVQFAADNCPTAAQYGYIKAWTPLLDEPLQGPVWLRSSSHKLPDMVFDLHGLVDVEVSTRLDSIRGGIRASVEDAPDAPISRVLLRMQGGKKGLIVNSRNLCFKPGRNRANVLGTGQNGKRFRSKPVMQARCGKARRKKHKRHHRRGGGAA